MTERFEIRYVKGHVEVYDSSGKFCFSADTKSEAESELLDRAAYAKKTKRQGLKPLPFSAYSRIFFHFPRP